VTIFKTSKIFEGILNDSQLFEGKIILGDKNVIDIIYKVKQENNLHFTTPFESV
jgi:hypothetical protein